MRCEVGKITTTEFDLLIIGGGLVGASLACALTGQGLRSWGYVAEARLLARQAMGLEGYLPRLAQGLPLLAGDMPHER